MTKEARLKHEMGEELNRILTFWRDKILDPESGRFHGRLNEESIPEEGAPLGLVLSARLLWTFARAYRHDGKTENLVIAEKALQILENDFRDVEYGGYYWTVDSNGKPLNQRKQVYGQAFVLYAISEYALAVGKSQIWSPRIASLIDVVERSFDPIHNGYYEAFTRDWKLEEDLRLSEHDMNESKSMNTHLHIMEAYTNAYRVWPSSIVRIRLKNLIQLTINRILSVSDGHFKLFFDERWSSKSDRISYGHDIEGSWLLCEAAEVLGDEELLAHSQAVALRMADAVLHEGVDQDGALWNESGPAGLIDRDKDWWPQAEAVIGFFNAWQLTGNDAYFNAAERAWSFIYTYLRDEKFGEWHWKVNEQGVPYPGLPKVNEWKCPYHNSRACFEIFTRVTDL
ncbi:AGE family epimerase/isomerase [Paenibacillus sp. P13VS]|uniref:AGE family epimerase/isomerase n=1 Tax=Paenibacillus sp. P13VS TaxID=2697367 RepID=UPI00187BC38F|nr:AGE family epimerase/isomerase [Paenibacillus sp. P13VS]MBE7680112.1 N-acyl-D-glucosamine 2-epimerase [Paenibacillus sp. P13VS]